MAKERIREISKEINVPNKDIIAFLAEKTGNELTPASGVEPDTAALIRDHFASGADKDPAKDTGKAAEKAPDEKKPQAKSVSQDTQTPDKAPQKKKKNISVVFNNTSRDPRNRQGGPGSKARSPRSAEGAPKKVSRRLMEAQAAEREARLKRAEAARKQEEAKQAAQTQPSHTKQSGSGDDNAPKAQTSSEKTAPFTDAPGEVKKPVIKRENVYANMRKKENEKKEREKRETKTGLKRDPRDKNKSKTGTFASFAKGAKEAFGSDNAPGRKNDGKGGRKNDYNKKDKHRGPRLDKSEKTISLEKVTRKKAHKNPSKSSEVSDEIRSIEVPEHLTVKELADLIKVQASDLIKKLFLAGKMLNLNSEIDYAQAEEIALEYNCIAEPAQKVDVIAELLKDEDDDESTLVSRPPVVCVMGHVDHGKTSLLDAIRHTRNIEQESGGITQAIGAYVVEQNGRTITFLDTPGHEAFTAMRMRGASSTDIAVLVVAADDGVMPQTVEAINHAKAAGIEIIVAINKIDKPSANIERVKQELSEYELIPEDWGGQTVFVPVSAHTKEGIDELLEMILLTSDVLELKANPKRKARGLVIESKLDKGKGVVATVLVQKGTLKVGEPIACGNAYGKVRAMTDENGRRVKEAGPSIPVEVQGLSEVPNAGEIFISMDSEKEARSFAQTFISENKNKLIDETRARLSLDDLFSQIQAGNVKELELIVKADVQGSVEALKQSLEKLSNEEVVIKIIHSGVGAITESDVVLATASNAIIIGFNVRPDATAKDIAEHEGVDIKLYNVIYNAIEDVEAAMKGMLDPVYEEKITGHAQIKQIFKASGVGNIAGSFVDDGYIPSDCSVRIFRGDDMIHEGKLASLKHFKDEVKEVKAGLECGMVFEDFDDIAVEDRIEAFIMVQVER